MDGMTQERTHLCNGGCGLLWMESELYTAELFGVWRVHDVCYDCLVGRAMRDVAFIRKPFTWSTDRVEEGE